MNYFHLFPDHAFVIQPNLKKLTKLMAANCLRHETS